MVRSKADDFGIERETKEKKGERKANLRSTTVENSQNKTDESLKIHKEKNSYERSQILTQIQFAAATRTTAESVESL